MMKKFEIFALIIILAGAFLVRLYHFNSPLADWHSWRQSDTSAVSRNFIKFGFDILHPRFDDISNGPSLMDNPMGYRFVEFPIYNILQAGLFKVFGHFTIEEWGRLVTIFSSELAIIFLYLIVRKYVSTRASFFAAFFYAFIPYNIYFGRVILPDQFMVTMMLSGLYFFDKWTEKLKAQSSKLKPYPFFILAVIFTALSILIKPFAVFFMLPMIYLVWRNFGLSMLVKKELFLFLSLSILPLILWRNWIAQYPEGIPGYNWLFNGDGIRFKGAFFHWLFGERISNLILGFFGLPLVVIGVLARFKKEAWISYLFLISALVYLTVVATGNVRHDYYQILIIPTLAIFFAKGVDYLLEIASGTLHKLVTYLTIIVCILFMLAFGWFKIRDFYSIQHPEIIEAGLVVDQFTPKTAKVIAVYNGDTTFLYHTKRQGWPAVERDLSDFINSGATHIAFVNPGKEELNFATQFATVKIAENFAIFDLAKPSLAGKEYLKKLIQRKEFIKRQDLLREKGLFK